MVVRSSEPSPGQRQDHDFCVCRQFASSIGELKGSVHPLPAPFD
jgi:hypothetical protein